MRQFDFKVMTGLSLVHWQVRSLCYVLQRASFFTLKMANTSHYNRVLSSIFEFLGNSLTQTNQTKQTKQLFNRLYYLDCWIHILQFDEQMKRSTKCILVQIIQFDELLFCLICLG